MRLPRHLLLAVVALAVLAFSGAALAGPVDLPKLKGAKSEDGPYKQDALPVTVDSPRNLFVKVIGKAEKPQSATLYENACCSEEDYSVRWFKSDIDISHDVQTSGHEFTLKPDKPRIFRVRVKPVADPEPSCLYPSIDVGSGETYGVYFALNDPDACL